MRSLPTFGAAVLIVATGLLGAGSIASAAESDVVNTAEITNIHCSSEGYFVALYSTTSDEPVWFVTHVDGTEPKDPISVTAQEPIGDSFGDLTEGSHQIEVFADGDLVLDQTIEIECVELGPVPVLEEIEDGHTGVAGPGPGAAGAGLPETGA